MVKWTDFKWEACCVFFCVYLPCNHHPDQDTDRFHHPRKSLCAPSQFTSLILRNNEYSINIDSEDTMILIRFFREVGENYPKVTEVSIQWLNEMNCPLNLRNKIALCLTQGLIRKTTWQESWKAGKLSQMERYSLWSHLKKVAYSSPLSVWHKYPSVGGGEQGG